MLMSNLQHDDFAQEKWWISFWWNWNIWLCWLEGCWLSSRWHAHLFQDCHNKSDSYSRHWPEWTPWPLIRFWLELGLLWLMTRNPRGQSSHLLNKLMVMLMHPRAELFALSSLAPTTWPKIAGRVTRRGWLTKHGGSTMKYSVTVFLL